MEYVNGEYIFQGIRCTDMCQKYGTPVYVYDASIIEEQYQKLVGVFSGLNVRLNYACKALSNISILKVINKLGGGLDTVSINEVKLGLKAGFDCGNISYTPSGVDFNEIKEAVESGVHITLDNFSALEKFGKAYGNSVPLSIRINPHVMAGGNIKISTGHQDSKFGISVKYKSKLLELIKKHNLRMEGLHIHTGSDILDIEAYLRAVRVLLDVATSFADLKFLDFGSGFKVPYKPGDVVTDIEKFGREIKKELSVFFNHYGRELTVMFEPGKFIVSQAGFFFVTVNVLKQTPSKIFAGVNSGLNHLIRPMFYGSHHEVINISNPLNKNPQKYDVVGYICETDTFAGERMIPEIKEGDILAFLNAGAYCFSMASNYNSRPRPAEVMVYKGQDYLIRKRENFDDLLHNQVEVQL